MQLALLFQFQIHTEKEKKKKTKKLNGLLGLGRKTKSIQTIPMGDLSVCVYAELHHITQTLGHDLDTGKIR